MTENERQAIRTVLAKYSDRRKLIDELFRVFRGTYKGFEDDGVIERFAFDETQEAYHLAVAYDLLREFGPDLRIKKTPLRDACALCKRTYIEADCATPKAFRLRDFLRHGPDDDYSGRQIGPFRWRFRLEELVRSQAELPAAAVPIGLVHSLRRCTGPEVVF